MYLQTIISQLLPILYFKVKVRHGTLVPREIVQIIFFVLLDFSLYIKAATLIFISGCGLAISSAKEGKSGFIYNLVKS